jgi:hypothetical protein
LTLGGKTPTKSNDDGHDATTDPTGACGNPFDFFLISIVLHLANSMESLDPLERHSSIHNPSTCGETYIIGAWISGPNPSASSRPGTFRRPVGCIFLVTIVDSCLLACCSKRSKMPLHRKWFWRQGSMGSPKYPLGSH